MSDTPVLGIDFGTSNTAAAWVDAKNRVRVVPAREGVYLLPSVVWYGERGQILVGDAARQQLIEDPEHTVHGLKRFIGRRWTSPFVHRHKDHFGYQMVEGGDGLVAIDLFGHQRSLVEVGSEVLRRIIELATASMRAKPEVCCLTVPAHYGYSQRQAIRQAAEKAGLQVKAMVNEPTAAAMYYARKKGNDGRVLVFDLGGGTFDATLLQIMGGVVKVLSTGGDAFLGGQDFDGRIVEVLASRFEDEHGIDLRSETISMWRTFVAAEAAKITLSTEDEARVRVPCITVQGDNFLDLDYVITRRDFEQRSAPLIEKCLGICEDILKRAKLKPDDVDEIVFVGGQTRMPAIQRRLAQIFKTNPEKHIHPDLGVAVGAALLARGDQSLIDVISAPLGVMVPGVGAKELIPANTTVPSVKRLPLGMRPKAGDPLVMALYESPDATSLEREHLGTTRCEGDWLEDNPGDLEIEAWVGDDLSISLSLHAQGGGRYPLEIERPQDDPADRKPKRKKKKKKRKAGPPVNEMDTNVDATDTSGSMEAAAALLGLEIEEDSGEHEGDEVAEEETKVDEPGAPARGTSGSGVRRRRGPMPPGFKSLEFGGGVRSENDGAVADSQRSTGESRMAPPQGKQATTGPKRSQSTGVGKTGDEAAIPQPGEIIGNYELVDVVGQGGMGRVFLAEHTVLGRRVALKMLRRRFSDNKRAVERFMSEARAVNQIRHENIIQVTDFITTEDGNTCYIMELLEGRSLADMLSSLGVPRLDRSLRIALQVADAMVAVHDAAIIHRDLKPENIFLTNKEGKEHFVKLLDFGVAKLVDNEGRSLHETGIGDAIGTPEYMSPEQLVGGQVDHRSDIYSLGVVLYELVTGHKPFDIDDSVGEAVFQQLMQPPTPPSEQPDLPHQILPELEKLILECLAKQATARPRSMREVRGRIEEMIESHARLMRTTRVTDKPAAPEQTEANPAAFEEAKTAAASPAAKDQDTTVVGASIDPRSEEEGADDGFENVSTVAVDQELLLAGFKQSAVSDPGSMDLVLLPGEVMTQSSEGPPHAGAALTEPELRPPEHPREEAPTPNLPHARADVSPLEKPTSPVKAVKPSDAAQQDIVEFEPASGSVATKDDNDELPADTAAVPFEDVAAMLDAGVDDVTAPEADAWDGRSQDLLPKSSAPPVGTIALAAGAAIALLIVLGAAAWLVLGGSEDDDDLIWGSDARVSPVPPPSKTPPEEPKPADPPAEEAKPVEDTPPEEAKPVEDKPPEEPKPVEEKPPVEAAPPVEDKPPEEPKPVEDKPPVEEPKPAKEKVRISFESSPSGADVYFGKRKLGTTPFNVVVRPSKRAAEFEFRKDGYVSTKKTLQPPKDDFTLQVDLPKK